MKTRCTCSFRTPAYEERHLNLFYVRVLDEKCPQHAPIAEAEISQEACDAFAKRPQQKQASLDSGDWIDGYTLALSDAIKKLEDFGLGTAEIRNALGLVKE